VGQISDILSVCLSVTAPIQSQFSLDCDETLQRNLEPEKIEFVRGSKSDHSFSYFVPIFTSVMHFQF